MVFSEIYSAYYNVLAAVLSEAVSGGLTDRRIREIVRERAFDESVLSIPAALKSGRWPLLDRENGTPIRHKPTVPLTDLERRWLKSLLLDPRAALFDLKIPGLEDVKPLFRPEDLVFFDRYADGDPYGDPGYIERFQTVLRAFREHRRLRIRFRGHRGREIVLTCVPRYLEFSAKDDKFRLIAAGGGFSRTVNLARILSCALADPCGPAGIPEPEPARVTFLLRDRRNALERVMLHFSHLEKTTERLEGDLYRVRLVYDRSDETEILIRLLSFGPMVKVTEPVEFVAKLRERLENQGPV